MRRSRLIIREPGAAELREKGNKSFMQKDYKAAITLYTAAIKQSANESILYSNRSRCYFMLKDYKNSIKDAEFAVKLDNNNLKAHILCIRALGNSSKLGMNTVEAEKALISCKAARSISTQNSQPEFQSVCKSLSKKLKALIFMKTRENFNYKVSRLKNYYKDLLKNKRLSQLFHKFLVEKKTRPISDTMCCPITLEIFTQPVITESGNSYEMNALLTHFTRMGVVDPITRIRINPYGIFNNSALVQAKKWFFKNEPWLKVSETAITSMDIEF